MCGPSGQEEQLANQEASLSTALDNAYKERFATQSQILGQVQDAIGQLRSGNFPPGYSPAVMSQLQTSVLNNVAGATRSARQAAGNAIAGEGGGAGSALVSGPQQEIQGEIAAAGATKQADLLNALNIKSFDLGRENLLQSIGGLQALAGAQDPLGFSGGSTSANAQAFNQAKDINQQKNQKWSDIASFASAGLGVLSGGQGLLGKMAQGGGSSGDGGIGSFADPGVFSSTTPQNLGASEAGFGTDWLNMGAAEGAY
jgi:hypothetical protein